MKALGKGSLASFIRIGLNLAWILLWAAAAGLALGAVSYAALLGLIQTGIVDPARFAELFAPTPDNPAGLIWPIAIPGFLIGAVSIGGGLIIVSRLKRLFDGFSSGEPFRKDNAAHLRVIWIAMLAIELSRMGLMTLMGALLAIFGPARGVGLKGVAPSIDLSTWMSILILIVLAEVFREGARLKQEQELTI